MPKFLVHPPTGTAYHSVGMTEVCAHALDRDGSFSTECFHTVGYDAGDSCSVDHPEELPLTVRKWIDKVRGHKVR